MTGDEIKQLLEQLHGIRRSARSGEARWSKQTLARLEGACVALEVVIGGLDATELVQRLLPDESLG